MAWIGADLETLPTIFHDKVSESRSDKSRIIEFSAGHEQRVRYGDFQRWTFHVTSGVLDATETAAFISFYADHGNLTPFKYVHDGTTLYCRMDGGFTFTGTVADGIKKSVRFSMKQVCPSEIIL